MEVNNILVATIQETNMSDLSVCEAPPGFCLIAENRGPSKWKGRGLAFLNLQFPHLKLDSNDQHK